MKLKASTLTEILKIREKFTPISSISFAFSKLNKMYPLDYLTEEQAQDLIKGYENLLDQIKNINFNFNNHEQSGMDKNS